MCLAFPLFGHYVDMPGREGSSGVVQIPRAVREWVDRICLWDFTRVISAHFNSPVDATPADFRSADAVIMLDAAIQRSRAFERLLLQGNKGTDCANCKELFCH